MTYAKEVYRRRRGFELDASTYRNPRAGRTEGAPRSGNLGVLEPGIGAGVASIGVPHLNAVLATLPPRQR